jgi:[ribosomal protein S5]-alanine N-acetyltransferase
MSLPTPTLHTVRLLLRAFTQADTDAIFALHSSPRVLRYWDAPPWSERTRAERFIAVCKQMEQEGSGARLAIERVADGVFIGWCCLMKWNPDYRSATMGYCLDDAAWGQGFATEAAGALLQWAFDTLDLNRVQAETDTRNTASGRVLEARLCARRHAARRLHREWRGVGFLGVWAAQAAVEAAAGWAAPLQLKPSHSPNGAQPVPSPLH